MKQTYLPLLVIATLLTVLLLGGGISGLVVKDATTRPLCETDADCAAPEVCCLFADKTAGVCDASSMCGQVDKVTRQEQTVALQQPAAVRDSYALEIAAGACILFLLLFAYSLKKVFLSMPQSDR